MFQNIKNLWGDKIGNVVVFFIFKHKTRTQRKIKYN